VIINVTVFANLKDHFESNMRIEVKENAEVQDVLNTMTQIKPGAEGIISACRTAIGDQMVDLHYKLEDEIEICLLPPSSGG